MRGTENVQLFWIDPFRVLLLVAETLWSTDRLYTAIKKRRTVTCAATCISCKLVSLHTCCLRRALKRVLAGCWMFTGVWWCLIFHLGLACQRFLSDTSREHRLQWKMDVLTSSPAGLPDCSKQQRLVFDLKLLSKKCMRKITSTVCCHGVVKLVELYMATIINEYFCLLLTFSPWRLRVSLFILSFRMSRRS